MKVCLLVSRATLSPLNSLVSEAPSIPCAAVGVYGDACREGEAKGAKAAEKCWHRNSLVLFRFLYENVRKRRSSIILYLSYSSLIISTQWLQEGNGWKVFVTKPFLLHQQVSSAIYFLVVKKISWGIVITLIWVSQSSFLLFGTKRLVGSEIGYVTNAEWFYTEEIFLAYRGNFLKTCSEKLDLQIVIFVKSCVITLYIWILRFLISGVSWLIMKQLLSFCLFNNLLVYYER